MTRAAHAAALLVILLLAGCAEPTPDARGPCRISAGAIPQTVGTGPLLERGIDPRQPQDMLLALWDAPAPDAVEPWADTGGFQHADRLEAYGVGAQHLVVARFDRVDVAANGTATLGAAWFESYARGDGCVAQHSVVMAGAGPAREGELAQPGMGAHVRTAGFLEDGSMFYTNLPRFEASMAPRVAWYAYEGDDPLRVYVYDHDRSERPAYWAGPADLAPATVPTLDDGLRQAQDDLGVGYGTTIRGFNEALKGLSTTTSRVVRIAPEDAYTQPGNEDHPLYGQALVFYIQVEDVVPVPCPRGGCGP